MKNILWLMVVCWLFSPTFCDENTSEESTEVQAPKEKKQRKKGKRKELIEKMRKKFDKDGDGQLSKEEKKRFHRALLQLEMKRKRRKLKKELDIDGDGQLSSQEQEELKRELKKFRANFKQRIGSKNRGTKEGENNPRVEKGDGRSPRRGAFRQKMMERFDVNNDGVLSEEEREEMRKAMQNKRQRRGRRSS